MKKVGVSIDGGGMRGEKALIEIAFIEQLVGAPLQEWCDEIGGTSTGAIAACAYSAGDGEGKPLFTTSEILHIYDKTKEEIFDPWKELKQTGIWSRLKFLTGLRERFEDLKHPKYKLEGMVNVMSRYLGDRKMGDAIIPVTTVSYDLLRTTTLIHYSKDTPNVRMVDAIVSSAAAPTYFPPHRFYSDGEEYVAIDGGACGMNNPTEEIASTMEARYKIPEEDIYMISFGTGTLETPVSYDKARKRGQVGWVAKKPSIFEVMMDGSSEAVHRNMCEQSYGYERFQMPITVGKLAEMDNISQEVRQAFRDAVRRHIDRNTKKYIDVAHRIQQIKGI